MRRKEIDLHTDSRSWGNVPGLVVLCLNEVTAQDEICDEAGIHGESCEYDPVCDVGVHSGKSVGLSGTEGVTDVDDLLECTTLDTGQISSLQALGQLGERSHLEE